jgi:PAS domain S-box-containing protein
VTYDLAVAGESRTAVADAFRAFGDRFYELAADEPIDSSAPLAQLLPELRLAHADKMRAAILAVRAGRGPQRFEYAVSLAGGARHLEARVALTARRTIAVVVRDINHWNEERNRLLESETRFRSMANHAPVLLWMTGIDGECNFFNQGWLEFTGRPLARELGVGWAEGVHFEDFQSCMTDYFASFVERRPFRLEYRLRRADGEYRWILDQGVPRFGPDGEFEGYIGSCIDVTALKQAQTAMLRFNAALEDRVRRRTAELDAALKEKMVLLREIHHRVKNNLQVISSLLNLQARHFTGQGSPSLCAVQRALVDCQGRVRTIALVHEKLYQAADLSQVDFGSYLRALVDMFRSTAGSPTGVRVACDIEDLRLAVDQAIPCGLLVHELVTNALKHAFPPGRRGAVHVELRREPPRSLRLVVRDDGVGLPASLDLERPPSLGLELVTTLARQLRAELRVERTHGTVFRLSFPEGYEAWEK